jgi:RND family efflux transporter MFP subunit
MSTDVDLRQLAIDRSDTDRSKLQPGRHVLTRYVLPLALVFGFCVLLAWATKDLLFPPRQVTVVPVFSTTAEFRQAGTPLFKAAGWIEPRPTPVRVAALAPGVVEKLLVVEDQPVKAGQKIAELVKDDARLNCERAQADLQLRQAELKEAEAELRAAETRLEQPVHLQAALGEAEGNLAKILTELKNLPFQLQRAQADRQGAQVAYAAKNAAQGVVAGVQIDLAKSNLDAASALVEELTNRKASLEKERQALARRRDALHTQLTLLADEKKSQQGALARLSAAKARVLQAQVALDEAQLQLDRMTIVSPIDGRVFRLFGHPGARIGSGIQMVGRDASTVVTLYRPDMLQVRVDVRFEDIPKVSLGQPVEIDNPALDDPLTGKVLFVSSEADIQKNTLQVKVEIPDPPSVFKPEMLVDVTFLAPEQPQRAKQPTQELKLYVLKQLLQQEEKGSYLWVADRSAGIARKTFVQTGATNSTGLVEITGGLTIASRIVVSGTENLQDGQRIIITGEDTSLGNINEVPHGKSHRLHRLPPGDSHP